MFTIISVSRIETYRKTVVKTNLSSYNCWRLHHAVIRNIERYRYRYQWIVMPIFESHNSIGSFEIYVPGIRIRISLICGTRYQAQA